MRRIASLIVLMLAALPASAANHYIHASASGTHTGVDWTNAWTALSQVTWIRGDVYYIAQGSYTGVTLSAVGVASSVIELRGAVGGAGDHGTATGWSDGFQGQAIITPFTITTNYWKFNGQAVPGCVYPNDTTSCHLIKVNNTSTGGQQVWLGGGGSAIHDITFDYFEGQGSNVHTDGASDEGIYCTPGPCTNTYIGHSWIHNVGCDNLSFNENTGGTGFVLEYSWISYNNFGPTTASHCQGIQSTLAQMTLRYNVWQDMQSSGSITDAAGGNAPITEWDIYGNIFFWDSAWNASVSGDGRVGYDDGLVGIFSLTGSSGILKIYNNTIYNLGLANSQNCNGQAYTINAGMAFASVVVENNIWAHFANQCNAGSAGPGTYNYNGYYTIANGTKDGGANTYTSSAQPFVSPTSSNVAGFALTADTTAGLSLSSPYNIDMLGVTRGASGTWDRGALQIASVGPPPPPPTGLHVIVAN